MTIIGIDNYEHKVKVQRSVTALGQHPHVDAIQLPESLFEKGSYPDILDKGLADYTEQFGPLPNEPVTLVIPDDMVTMDTIVLPTMSKRTMGDTFRTEYQNLYKNHDELISVPVVINANKKTTTYLLTMIRKDLAQRFREVLAGRTLKLDKIVTAAAAKCEALTDQHMRLHRDTYLFMDVFPTKAQIILYDKGRMFGFAALPFGMDALPDDRVVDEYFLYEHDIADLAVINAREKAKAAKLTMMEEENINADVLTTPDANAAMSKQDLMAMAQEMHEEELAAQEQLNAAAEEDDSDETEEPAEEAAPAVQTTPQGKRYVKKARKFPVYMQRPVPETANGMVCENFRAFQSRLLGYARACRLNEHLPDPQYIVVNLPKEYEFLVQTLNAQEDNALSFKLLCDDGHSSILTDLEMHGATKITNRSRNPLF